MSSTAVTDSSTRTASGGGSDYDRVVRELVFERKAMATDRLKTTEELAREERDRLMKLEVWNHCGINLKKFTLTLKPATMTAASPLDIY